MMYEIKTRSKLGVESSPEIQCTSVQKKWHRVQKKWHLLQKKMSPVAKKKTPPRIKKI